MQPQTIDITKITDPTTLKALRGDEYQKREDARATIEQAERNINLLNQRIAGIENAPAPKVPGTDETPAPQPSDEPSTSEPDAPAEDDENTSELR